MELPPADRIQIAKQAVGVVVPTPPKIARQRPEFFLCRGDKAIERAGFAHHRRHLGGGLRQHADFILAEEPGFHRLDHQHTLQNAAVDQRNAQERLVIVFPGFAEILESRMILGLLHGHRAHQLRHQAGQTFV